MDHDATYRHAKNTAPATKSSENSSTISTVEFRNKHAPSTPLNLLGGNRWPDANSPVRGIIKAVIDTEIGRGRATIVSPDGVSATIVRKRNGGGRP